MCYKKCWENATGVRFIFHDNSVSGCNWNQWIIRKMNSVLDEQVHWCLHAATKIILCAWVTIIAFSRLSISKTQTKRWVAVSGLPGCHPTDVGPDDEALHTSRQLHMLYSPTSLTRELVPYDWSWPSSSLNRRNRRFGSSVSNDSYHTGDSPSVGTTL